MITHINTVTLYVTDQRRARDFYVDELGFEVRADADMGPMGRWLEVAPPGAQTAFMLADAASFDKIDAVGKSTPITLSSHDVAALHDELAAKGVSVDEVQQQDWGTFMHLTDPDGHTFVISQAR